MIIIRTYLELLGLWRIESTELLRVESTEISEDKHLG